MKNSSKRDFLKNFLYVPILTLAGYCSTGCQNISYNYLDNPTNTSFVKRELAQTQLCLDAKFPRTAGETTKRLGNHITNVLPDAVDLVCRVPALVGIDPSNGRYFGKQSHPPIFNISRNYEGESSKKRIALALHPLNWLATSLESFGNLKSDLSGSVVQSGNLIMQPLYSNTSQRDRFFSDSKDINSKNDIIELVYDSSTDLVKGPIRTGLYIFTSDICPDTYKHLIDKVREEAGYKITRQNPLENKFNFQETNKTDKTRLALNAIPGIDRPFDKLIYGTMSRGKDIVTTTIFDSIPSQIKDDTIWYSQMRGNEKNAPGIITTIQNSPNFYPNEPIILGFLRGLWTGTSFLLNTGGSSSSLNSPNGGGTSGWSTGQ